MNTNDTKSMVIYQLGFSLFMALDTSNINVTQVGGCDFIKEYEEYKYDSLSKHHLSYLYLCNIANAYSYILHEISMDPRLKEALVSIVHRCLTML